MADKPPYEAPPEHVVRTIDDPDFGKLDLVVQHFWAQSRDSDWTLHDAANWQGETNGIQFRTHAKADETEPKLGAARATMRRFIDEPQAIVGEAAAEMIDTAIDWAGQLDLPKPTLASLQAALRFEAVDYGGERITAWIADGAEIFGGHIIEMRYNPKGKLIEACLAG
jgi:hypothetical protein